LFLEFIVAHYSWRSLARYYGCCLECIARCPKGTVTVEYADTMTKGINIIRLCMMHVRKPGQKCCYAHTQAWFHNMLMPIFILSNLTFLVTLFSVGTGDGQNVQCSTVIVLHLLTQRHSSTQGDSFTHKDPTTHPFMQTL
jgi:hypothetical protein